MKKKLIYLLAMFLLILSTLILIGAAGGAEEAAAAATPGTPAAAPLADTSGAGSEPTVAGAHSQQEKEIDEVWTRIRNYLSHLSQDAKSKVWNSPQGWQLFTQLYPSPITPTPIVRGVRGGYRGLQFADTTYIPAIVTEAERQNIHPCYPLVAIKHESGGRADVVGNDANVPGCLVIARRILLMKKSANCQQEYSNISALMTECKNEKDTSFIRYIRPKSGVNACLDDFLDTSQYNLPKLTQSDFCNNHFDADFTYGIGLGQITPPRGKTTARINNVEYTHCQLFDPDTNIKATVALLKEKVANEDTNGKAAKVFGKYTGAGEKSEGAKGRAADFKTCVKSEPPDLVAEGDGTVVGGSGAG